MRYKIRIRALLALLIILGVPFVAFTGTASAQGITPIETPAPKPGSYGLEATKMQDPPTTVATITTPGNGSSFTTSPITVAGICTTDLLVQVYNNGVMVGSVPCENGSFRLEVGLFAGVNELSAIMYDSLEQASPVSNIVTVNYTNTQFSAFGDLVTLTSSFGRRSAPAGSALTWPLQLSGGTGPYAFSLDWGDGTTTELMSQSLAGVVNIQHPYKKAGIYRLNVRAVDKNGVTAFLQLVAVSSGLVEATASAAGEESTGTRTTVLWVPAVVALVMLIPTYWLGRRSQVVSLRNKMLKDRDNYKEA
jgi:hypothetical protein